MDYDILEKADKRLREDEDRVAELRRQEIAKHGSARVAGYRWAATEATNEQLDPDQQEHSRWRCGLPVENVEPQYALSFWGGVDQFWRDLIEYRAKHSAA